jgi:hypothetical protein
MDIYLNERVYILTISINSKVKYVTPTCAHRAWVIQLNTLDSENISNGSE